MDKNTIKPILDIFISKVTSSYPINTIMLFGSFAQGTPRVSSDIDLLVVGDFDAEHIADPTRALYDVYKGIATPHEFHVYGMTTKDYLHRHDSLTLESIRKSGIPLYVAI